MAAKKKEKQEWTTEKPKLDNARKLRCIYSIDSEDGEYKETIKNARKKLEVSVGAAMLCKMGTKSVHGSYGKLWRGENSNSRKNTTYASIVEAPETQ